MVAIAMSRAIMAGLRREQQPEGDRAGQFGDLRGVGRGAGGRDGENVEVAAVHAERCRRAA
ncbi:hypothetical protein SLUN_36025 [Streptomyces lunaelactis]|uniref:Uncharacterized protein n=1 Tax=Streptomyces lunaelactis TaxID=1535768 RepID=A0A2R4TCE1_9ACTN|nr:hypothetical protein SLUN_36025 [Streptomyces lunaelactis]